MGLGGIFTNSRCPIGIDIQPHAVYAAQAEARGQTLRLIDRVRVPLDPILSPDHEQYTETLGRAVGEMLGKGRFFGNRVVMGLPTAAVHFKNIRLPKMPPDELHAAVEWEAQERLPIQGKADVQYFDAGEVRQGDEQRQEVILVALTHAFAEAQLQMLLSHGVDPIAFEIAPTAISRLIQRTGGNEATDDPDQAVVCIDIAQHHTEVLILRGQQVVFYKPIDIGSIAIDHAIAERLDVSMDEAAEMRSRLDLAAADSDASVRRAVSDAVRPVAADLGREIGLCLRYYGVTFRGRRPDSALITGRALQEQWLKDSLEQTTALRLTDFDPFARVDPESVNGKSEDGSGTWARAIGFSLHQESSRLIRGAA